MTLQEYITRVLKSSAAEAITFSIKPYSFLRKDGYTQTWPLMLARIREFKSPYIVVNKDRFKEIASAVKAERICVVANSLLEEGVAQYWAEHDRFEFKTKDLPAETLQATTELNGLIIHEAVHAICDMLALGSVPRPTAEAAGYIAQVLYIKAFLAQNNAEIKGYSNKICAAADALIGAHKGPKYSFSFMDCVPLMEAILKDSLYTGKRFAEASFDGIPQIRQSCGD